LLQEVWKKNEEAT